MSQEQVRVDTSQNAGVASRSRADQWAISRAPSAEPASPVAYPSLYQINTRVWMTELSMTLGRRATLDDIPDSALDTIAKTGFDWVWLLSVWETGDAGRRISRENPEWRQEFVQTLPDLAEKDIAGSGFAITNYRVNPSLGDDSALERVRERLRQRNLRLMLDFVPNHTALDHPWVESHPEYYVAGSEADLARSPQNYIRVHRRQGDRVLAHGRDPYFPGWPDTLQLDYSNPATTAAMLSELAKVAQRCDGVRCDMAMLMLPDVFERTWGRRAQPFWDRVTREVHGLVPGFRFMAEVYWDLEWTLLQLGFDYAYDKRLYDRLHAGQARPVREHLYAGLDYQARLARFLENHDEPRAATTFPGAKHEAAAVITYTSPGLRFLQEGQFEGRTKRVSPHLVRRPDEPVNAELQRFYDRLGSLLRHPIVRSGVWRLLECSPAWEGNWTWDCFVAYAWEGDTGRHLLIAVNFAPNQSQCFVRWPFKDLENGNVRLADVLGDAVYERSGGELASRGLYLDMPGWGYHAFEVGKA